MYKGNKEKKKKPNTEFVYFRIDVK